MSFLKFFCKITIGVFFAKTCDFYMLREERSMHRIFKRRWFRRSARRSLTAVVSAALVLSVMQVPVYAGQDSDGSVRVEADGTSVSETYEEVDYTGGDGKDAVVVSSDNGGDASVSTTDINALSLTPHEEPVLNNYGLDIESEHNSQSSASSHNVTSMGSGLRAYSADGGSASARINGDIWAKGDGIRSVTNWDSTNNISVIGDVTGNLDGLRVSRSTGQTDIEIGGSVCGARTGIDIPEYSATDGTLNVTVGGEVYGAAKDGVYAYAQDGANVNVDIAGSVEGGRQGVYVENGHYPVEDYPGEIGGNISIKTGDITGQEDGIWTGTYMNGVTDLAANGNITGSRNGIYAINEATTNIEVTGDVKGNGNFGIHGNSYEGKLSVVVDGTVSGKKAGVYTSNDGNSFDLAVWKIDLNEDKHAAVKINDDDMLVPNEEFESRIKYLVKLSQPESGATLTVTDENGNALSTIESMGNTYEYAYEGSTVLLKVNVNHGYKLTGAFNNDGASVPLLQDAGGNYYIQVQKGGGVLLSVTLDRVPVPDSVSTNEVVPSVNEQPPVIAGAPACSCSCCTPGECSVMVSQITSAPIGGSVSLWATAGSCLCPCLVSALLARADLTVTIMFATGGTAYSVTIPAGADLGSLVNASGGIDLATLATAFTCSPI